MNTKNTIQHKARPHNQYSIKYLQNCIKKEDTRVHYTVLKQHQAPHTPPAAQHHDQHTRHPHQEHTTTPLSQTPNTMTNQTRPPPTATHKPHTTHTGQSSTRKKHSHAPDNRTRGNKPKKLLRKEVIQPHLPVRLPCYDFVPIADPTFDGSLTSLGHRLRVLPTFMT